MIPYIYLTEIEMIVQIYNIGTVCSLTFVSMTYPPSTPELFAEKMMVPDNKIWLKVTDLTRASVENFIFVSPSRCSVVQIR